MKHLVYTIAVVFGSLAIAQELSNKNHFTDNTLDRSELVAPVVSSTSDLGNKQAGMIVYDASAGTFKGYNDAGTWSALSLANGNAVKSVASGLRIETARLINNGSACSITQPGTWISTAVRNGSGRCDLTFVASMFSSNPVCVCTSDGAANRACTLFDPALTSGVGTITYTSDSGTATDYPVNLICIGAS